MTTWLDRNLIQTPFYLAVVTSEEEYLTTCKEFHIEYPDRFVGQPGGGCCHFFKGNTQHSNMAIVAIDVKHIPGTEELVGLCAHEATHLWQEAIALMGEKYPSSEFEAYSIQWFTQQIFGEAVKKMKRKKSESNNITQNTK